MDALDQIINAIILHLLPMIIGLITIMAGVISIEKAIAEDKIVRLLGGLIYLVAGSLLFIATK